MIYDYMTKTKCPLPSYEDYTKKLNKEGITEVDRLIIIMETRLVYRIARLKDLLDCQMIWIYEKYFEENMV